MRFHVQSNYYDVHSGPELNQYLKRINVLWIAKNILYAMRNAFSSNH